MNESVKNTKCITACIIGKPNTGKSTLLNNIIKHKLSIVTPKVQTTRSIITGVITLDETQVILFDTPGIFEPKKKLEKAMVRCAWSSLNGADIVLIMLDTTTVIDDLSRQIIGRLGELHTKFIFILNKIDRNNRLIEEIEAFLQASYPDNLIFKISALNGEGVDKLTNHIRDIAAEQPWLYDQDEITNLPMRFLASEIIREQLFLQLHEELPYNLTVQSEQWKENPNKSVTIHQLIIISRQNYKSMILGEKGSRIKEIGTKARLEMEAIFGFKVHLFLFVKVKEEWQDMKEFYNYLGLTYTKDAK